MVLEVRLASTLAAVITYIATLQLSLPNWTKLTTGTAAFLTIYATVASLTDAINKTCMQNLREMLKEPGPPICLSFH